MKLGFIYILLFLTCLNTFAHDSNQAHYSIEQEGNSILVNAEFPWSIRNALLTFAPELRKPKSTIEYEQAFFNYVKENLVLIDTEGNHLKLLQVKTVKTEGHSHQTNYTIKFEGTDFFRLKNTILFNVNKSQTNYHKFKKDSGEIIFETTNNQEVFIFQKKNIENDGRNYLWFLVLFCVPFIVFTRKFIKNTL